MAKRKTTQERAIEKELQNALNELGRTVTVISSRNSKISTVKGGKASVQKRHLRDSANYRVKPFNVLIVSQYKYGKYNTPKGQATPKDRSNIKNTPLLNSIDENVPKGVDIVVKELTKLVTDPISNK